MKHKNKIKESCLILISMLLCFSISSAIADGDKLEKGDITDDGLTVVKVNRHTAVELRSDVDWKQYTKYQLLEVPVAFRKDWQRDYNRDQKNLQGRISDDDVLRMKAAMSKIVYEELDKELQKKGNLTKTETADSNTLIIRPVIIDLDVYAPDNFKSAAGSKTYVREAGRATLFLEAYDAVSGAIIARYIDAREDPDNGYAQWATRSSNTMAAKRVVQTWAKRLVDGLEELKEGE